MELKPTIRCDSVGLSLFVAPAVGNLALDGLIGSWGTASVIRDPCKVTPYSLLLIDWAVVVI